jgi:hypothetical protein
MGLAVSLILIAAGAILAWGVTDEPEGLNLDAIGVVLIVIGIVGFILSLLLWRSWWGPGYFQRSSYVEGAAPARPWYGGWGRRTTYVEDDVGPPPGGPPPPPP